MDITITPGKLHGNIDAIPSKSQAHRLLICAAFSSKETTLYCPATNRDIEATVDCLRSLGATITRSEIGYTVVPIKELPAKATLDVCESGSTLRFMLPIAGALGVECLFKMSGRLPYRPLSPLWEEMERKGCQLSRPTETTIRCTGKLQSGNFTIDGGVSSQFITGMLFAMALMDGKSQLTVKGKLESKPYVDMTQQALSIFGVNTDNFCVCGSYPFNSPKFLRVEGDWSNAAFFLTANSLGSDITLSGLDENSPQGDRAISKILDTMDTIGVIDAADIPDLVPIMAVAAGAKKGATFTNIARLRLKESDRVATVCEMLLCLGVPTESTENELKVFPAPFRGCTIDSAGDHRIAMAAAIAATIADNPVAITGAQCVEKSYPAFWEAYKKLGGCYEQYIR